MPDDSRVGKRAKKINFTDVWVRRLLERKHPGAPRLILYYDSGVPGLNVQWSGKGRASWGLIEKWPGTKSPGWRALGRCGVMTLAEAREECRKWIKLVDKGKDPAVVKQQRDTRTTWPELRTAFLEFYRDKAKHAEASRILGKDFACWNDRYADEIRPEDVHDAVAVMIDRGVRAQASNALAYVRRVYGWAQSQPRLRITSSPCEKIVPRDLVGRKIARSRVLTDDELRAIWNAAGSYPYGSIVRVLMLTGLRVSEAAGMQWPEVDVPNKLWTIPSSRMKGPRDIARPPHEVPLAIAMLTLLESLPRFEGGPYAFSFSAGYQPVNSWSKAKRRLDELSGVSGWVIHDVRRSVRTRLSSLPSEEHIREAILGHGRRGIASVYDQHRYREQKAHLLQLWDDRLQRILDPLPASVRQIA